MLVAAAGAPAPVRFFVSANTISGVSFFKKPSFCDAITSPEILSLPVENSFIASAWPVAIAMKSASLISSVQAALPTAPSCTAPGGVDRSTVHCASGLASLNRNGVFTFSCVAGLACTNVPMARKISLVRDSAASSALVGIAVAAAALGAAFADD